MQIVRSTQRIREIIEQSQQKMVIHLSLHLTVLLIPQTPLPNLLAGYDSVAINEFTITYGAIFALFGIFLLGVVFVLRQFERISPVIGLYGIMIGFAMTAIGATILSVTSPGSPYITETTPFSRGWFPIIALLVGVFLAALTVIIGWRRWPPRT